MKTLSSWSFAWIILGLVLSPLAYGQHQLIKNGNLQQVLHGWAVNPVLGAQIPYSAYDNAIDMAPWLPGWTPFLSGTVVSQPLNVSISPATQLNFSLDVKAQNEWISDGATVAVYLEYIDLDGERVRERILQVPNDETNHETWTTFPVTHFVPSGMTRLVGLSLDRDGWGSFYVRNISLLSPVAGGAIPTVGQIDPGAVGYGQTFALPGQNFGSTEGILTVGGSTEGVEILSWTSSLIQARLQDPSVGGTIMLETAEGVRTWQSRSILLSDPYYRIYASPTAGDMKPFPLALLPGETAEAGIFLRFFNGYTPAHGISLRFPDEDLDGSFGYEVLEAPGGSLVSVDTTGWAPGLYTVEVEADDGDRLPRRTSFQIDVKDVQDVRLVVDWDPMEGMTFTRQGSVNFWVEFYDSDDNPIQDLFLSPLTFTSSSPFAINPFVTPGVWGEKVLLVNDTVNNATITTTLPDGRQFPTTVSASIPAEPRITSAGFTQNTMTNFPGGDLEPPENANILSWFATGDFSRRSWSTGGGFYIPGGIDGSGSSASVTFYAGEELEPGQYLWTVGGVVDGISVSVGRVVTVINDPNTGLITGKAVTFGGGHGHGVHGTLELYDAGTGDLLEEIEIWGGGNVDNYVASRVTPGSYRLRWVPDDWTGAMLPQWYPNAESFAAAETVTVTAGGTLEDIDFFCIPVNPPVVAPPFSSPPSYNPQTGTFSISVVAEDNVEYVLEKSETMQENTWIQVGGAFGWDGTATLSDPDATGTRAFYRVRRQ